MAKERRKPVSSIGFIHFSLPPLSSLSCSMKAQGFYSPWSFTFLIAFPGVPPLFSDTLSHFVKCFSLSLYPFFILIFAAWLCLHWVGKWEEQSLWGSEDHLELGNMVFVAQPAGHIKRWGRVWWWKRVMQRQRGVSRELRVIGFEMAEGTGCAALGVAFAFKCSEAELVACHSRPQPS